MTDEYDLIVIGAGMAGITAANKCAAEGWRVAIADPLPYGGTCALRGCDPKKILRRGAEVVDAARLMDGKGIVDGGLSIDWPSLVRHKRGFTDEIPRRMEEQLARNGVDRFHAAARFTGPDRVEIDGAPHTATRFLIATGARPRPLTFPGHEHLIDSTGFLERETLPRRIAFVGGGFISFEFAHIAARAGAECTVVHRHERPLTGFDPDLVDRLVDRTRSLGVRVISSAEVDEVSPTATGAYRLAAGGASEELEADLVVHGAGRVAALDGLGLEAAAVAHSASGVRVSGHLQTTSNPRVFAAGDAADTDGRPLTPVAVSEGEVAASNMLTGATTTPDHTGVPTTVFTVPELNRVGMREDEARALGREVVVRSLDTSPWFSNYRVGETAAAAKIVIDPSTDRILGAHLLGPEYAELTNIFGMAIRLGLTTRQLSSVTMTYPSVGSDLASML